jgi:6-pyruvoyl-tetrahydropterin synthase
MKKELILEISRIHKMMGVSSNTIINESTGCPLCDVINSKIDDLARKFANQEIGHSRFQYEVDELIRKIEFGVDNTGKKILNLNELQGLSQIKKNLDNLKKTSDNIDSYKSSVKNAINNTGSLSDRPLSSANYIKTKIIDVIDWDSISKKPEYSDYVFKNSNTIKETLSDFDNLWLNKSADEIKQYIDTYKTIDSYAESIKQSIKKSLINKGFEETLAENLSEAYKTWTKNNPNINKHFGESTTIYKTAEDRTVPQRFGKNYDSIDKFAIIIEFSRKQYIITSFTF